MALTMNCKRGLFFISDNDKCLPQRRARRSGCVVAVLWRTPYANKERAVALETLPSAYTCAQWFRLKQVQSVSKRTMSCCATSVHRRTTPCREERQLQEQRSKDACCVELLLSRSASNISVRCARRKSQVRENESIKPGELIDAHIPCRKLCTTGNVLTIVHSSRRDYGMFARRKQAGCICSRQRLFSSVSIVHLISRVRPLRSVVHIRNRRQSVSHING